LTTARPLEGVAARDKAPSHWGKLKGEIGINDGRVFESEEDAEAVIG